MRSDSVTVSFHQGHDAIMSTTKAAGLIEVARGTGGVTITRPLEEKLSEITLADVKKNIAVYTEEE